MRGLFLFSMLGFSVSAVGQEAITSIGAASEAPAVPLSAPEVGLFSAHGPGDGELRLGLGTRILLVIPMLDANLAYGVTDKLSLEARGSAIGVPFGGGASISFGLFEAGARYQIREGEKSTLSLRGNAMFIVSAATSSDDVGAALGARVSPGMLASWEKPRRTFSLGLDAPVSFAEGGVGTTNAGGEVLVIQSTGVSAGLSPSFSIEKPLENRTLYSQLEVETLFIGDTRTINPFLSVGLSW